MGTEQILFSASIIVAFLSGMVALFAPCCITFLLPAYLGQIFRARGKILLGTAFFGLGIATIMLPIALGLKVLVSFVQEYHIATYVTGGLMMVFFGAWTLLGKELTLPFARSPRLSNKIEFGSLYGLGVFGGITSACCAPVLAGALILAGLSATLLKTIAVGFSYVAGIVFPLFLGALLWESNPLSSMRSFLAKPVSLTPIGIQKETPLGNFVSGFMFLIFGTALTTLAFFDKIAMPEGASSAGAIVGIFVLKVGSFLKNYPYAEYGFLVILIILVSFFVKKAKK